MSKCPSCGKPASGKFCSSCGSPLEGRQCRSCGAGVAAGDRFCHKCGAPAAGSALSRPGVPWIVAGAAVAVVLLVIIVRFTGSDSEPGSVTAAPPGNTPAGGPIDLAQMTPREAADRLFDRIMRAHEAGNTDQVSFFLPMAVQSYSSLGELDADARYHLGLIQAVGGQVDGALAQADSLERAVPTHLFTSMLRASASKLTGDSTALRQAYRQFLDHFQAEMSADRPEYAAHRTAVDNFRIEAGEPARE